MIFWNWKHCLILILYSAFDRRKSNWRNADAGYIVELAAQIMQLCIEIYTADYRQGRINVKRNMASIHDEGEA